MGKCEIVKLKMGGINFQIFEFANLLIEYILRRFF